MRKVSQGLIGAEELETLMKSLTGKEQYNVLRSALQAGASSIAKEAKARCPVRTGALKKSIKASGERPKKGSQEIGSKVQVLAPHGHLVENGFFHQGLDHHVPGRPFLMPAFLGREGEIQESIREKMFSAIQKQFAKRDKLRK